MIESFTFGGHDKFGLIIHPEIKIKCIAELICTNEVFFFSYNILKLYIFFRKVLSRGRTLIVSMTLAERLFSYNFLSYLTSYFNQWNNKYEFHVQFEILSIMSTLSLQKQLMEIGKPSGLTEYVRKGNKLPSIEGFDLRTYINY